MSWAHCDVPLLFGPLAGPGALALFGLAGGVHCLGMCGPLSCLAGGSGAASGPRPGAAVPAGAAGVFRRRAGPLAAYHLARLLSYAALGALAALAAAPLRLALPRLAFAFLAAFPLLAFAVLGRETPPGFLGRLYGPLARRLLGFGAAARSAGLGLLSPLLPCGLLYAALALCASAPSAARGALWMLAFGGGTLPWLLLGQLGYTWAARAAGARSLSRLRRGLGLLAAAVLLVLAWGV